MTNDEVNEAIGFLKTAQVSLENAMETCKTEPVAVADVDKIWEQIATLVDYWTEWKGLAQDDQNETKRHTSRKPAQPPPAAFLPLDWAE